MEAFHNNDNTINDGNIKEETEEYLFVNELEQIRPKKSVSVKFTVPPRKARQNPSEVEESYYGLNTNDRFRSHSHFLFKYRPEMVPQIKPKTSTMKPSPMKLCKKPSHVIRDNINNIDCFSCSDSDNSFSFINESEASSPINSENNISVTNLRKQMSKLKTFSLIMNDNTSKDYESLLKTEKIVNNDIINLEINGMCSRRQKKRVPYWKKYIVKLQEDQLGNWLYKSELESSDLISSKTSISTNHNDSVCDKKKNSSKKVRHTVGDCKPSILDILECAANEKKTRQSNLY
jgi:hypothetical protein